MERSRSDNELIAHMVDLLSAKDPLAYQAITTAAFASEVSFDPSPEAELQRIKERTGNDILAYDEYGPGDDDELAVLRDELGI